MDEEKHEAAIKNGGIKVFVALFILISSSKTINTVVENQLPSIDKSPRIYLNRHEQRFEIEIGYER